MKLTKEVSLSEAKKLVQDALMGISNGNERAAMAVALMQYQDALTRERQYTTYYGVARLDADSMVVDSEYVSRDELEDYVKSTFGVDIPEFEIFMSIHKYGSYKMRCFANGNEYDILIEPYEE